MRSDDSDRKSAREKFKDSVQTFYGAGNDPKMQIPHADGRIKEGSLPALRFKPTQSRGTIVFFGGFDSYMEELTLTFFYLRDAGYEVIAFEGPGQGSALNDAGLPMTPDWHKPVKSVLDYFGLDQVTLAGLSLGMSRASRRGTGTTR